MYELRMQVETLCAQQIALSAQIQRLLEVFCPSCHGAGYIEEARFGDNEQTWTEETPCEACGGSGRVCGIRDNELDDYVDAATQAKLTRSRESSWNSYQWHTRDKRSRGMSEERT